jgi:hypothetical protein
VPVLTAPEEHKPRPDERGAQHRRDGAEIARIFDDEVLAWIQTPPKIQIPPQDDDPAAQRSRKAEALAAMASGRAPLEALRAVFISRLHRASDDFEATEGLRVVEAALSRRPWPEQANAQDRRRRPRWRMPRRRESPR